jgi:hypothetical protein
MTNHQCSHRLGDGRPCGSPRQANKNYCYWHTRVHENYLLPGNRHYNPPPLTDFHNISIALSHVWSALSKSMITHKQACAMAYQIQIAKQTLKDILKMEKEMKDAGIETCGTDILVGECGEGAPSLPSVGKGGTLNDDTPSESSAIDDPAPPEQNFSDPIHYDPEHPPLALEPALRPMPTSPAPAPDSVPTFIPISEKEYEWMNKYITQGFADPLPDTILRRRLLNIHFKNCPTPPPEEIARILFEFDEDQARRVKEREDAMRTIRAKKRDLRNQEILGF